MTIAATQPAVLVVSNKRAARTTAELLTLLEKSRGKYELLVDGRGDDLASGNGSDLVAQRR